MEVMGQKRPHPVPLIVCLLGISALFAGCEAFAHFEHRAPATAADLKRIEVFRTNTKPSGKVREIGMVAEEGTLAQQNEIEARFIRKARKAGADALIFEPTMRVGQEVKFFATADTYSFRATLVSYEN
jgi:hypothetical protein